MNHVDQILMQFKVSVSGQDQLIGFLDKAQNLTGMVARALNSLKNIAGPAGMLAGLYGASRGLMQAGRSIGGMLGAISQGFAGLPTILGATISGLGGVATFGLGLLTAFVALIPTVASFVAGIVMAGVSIVGFSLNLALAIAELLGVSGASVLSAGSFATLGASIMAATAALWAFMAPLLPIILVLAVLAAAVLVVVANVAMAAVVFTVWATAMVANTVIMGGFAAGIAAINVGILKMGIEASKSAGQLEQLKAQLEGLAGSKAGGVALFKDIYALSQKPGMGSAVDTLQALTDFMKQGGQSYEKSRAMLEALGNFGVMRGMDPELIKRAKKAMNDMLIGGSLAGQEELQFKNAGIPIQRITQEAFGTSDTDALREMGVTAQMVFDAIQGYFDRQPKAINNAMVAWQNFGNAFELLQQTFGAGINAEGGLLGLIRNVTQVIDNAIANGTIEKFGTQIASIFTKNFGGGGTDAITFALASVMAGMETMIMYAPKVGEVFRGMFNTLIAGLNLAVVAFRELILQIAGIIPFGRQVAEALLKINPIASIGAPAAALGADMGKTFSELQAKYLEDLKKPGGGPNAGDLAGAIDNANTQTALPGDLAGAIDNANTQTALPERLAGAIADGFSQAATATPYGKAPWGNQTFGGDDLGRMGVSPVEIGAMNRDKNIKVTIDAKGAQGGMVDMMTDFCGQIIRQMIQQGAFRST